MVFSDVVNKNATRKRPLWTECSKQHPRWGRGEGSDLPISYSSLLGDMISPGEKGLDLVTLKKC